jgi:hypothetical protein
MAAVGARDRCQRGVGIEALPERRLVDHVRELGGVEGVGEVDERARDGRHGDAGVGRDVARVEAAARVEPEPGLGTAFAGRQDLDRVRASPPDLP